MAACVDHPFRGGGGGGAIDKHIVHVRETSNSCVCAGRRCLSVDDVRASRRETTHAAVFVSPLDENEYIRRQLWNENETKN